MHDGAVGVAVVAEVLVLEALEHDELAQGEGHADLGLGILVGEQLGHRQDGVLAALQEIAHGLGHVPGFPAVDVLGGGLAAEIQDTHHTVKSLACLVLVLGQHGQHIELAVLVLDQDPQGNAVDLRSLGAGPFVLAGVRGARRRARVPLCAARDGQAAGVVRRVRALARGGVLGEVLEDLQEHRLDGEVELGELAIVASNPPVGARIHRDLEDDHDQCEEH